MKGLSEALAKELAPLGHRVIIVKPRPLRTEFLGRSIKTAKAEIGAYAESSGKRRQYHDGNNGRQTGDSYKALTVILRAVDADAPPLHLPLGSVANATAERKLDAFRIDMEAWREVAIATDFS